MKRSIRKAGVIALLIMIFAGVSAWMTSEASLLNDIVSIKVANQHTLTLNPNGGSNAFHYIKFENVNPVSGTVGQASQFRFLTYGGDEVVWTETPVISNGSGYANPSSAETETSLFDNSSSTKWRPNSLSNGTFVAYFYNAIDLSNVVGYRFYNGDDTVSYSGRRFATYDIYVSNDGSEWYQIITYSGSDWATNNSAIAYADAITNLFRRQIAVGDAYGVLPVSDRVGYDFTGWYTETSGGTQVSASDTMGYTDVTIYAHWTPTTYSISYDLDGGSVSSTNPASYTIESSAITLNNPTKTGYTFMGWTGTGLSEATQNVTIAAGSNGNRSYTANWQITEYDITYYLDEDTTLYDDAPEGYSLLDYIETTG